MSQTERPVRCLVVQMARLGDTLQSLMALRAAKQLYPCLEIHFVARERFAEAVKRVSWIKSAYTLPIDALVGPVLRGERSEVHALGDLARWIAPLVQEPWDLIVNWSYSESSSFLTGLLPARIKLGYSRRKDLTLSSADGWSHYIQAIVQGGPSNEMGQSIHLTDILTTQLLTALQIHVGEPANEGNAPVTSKGFFTLNVNERDFDRIGSLWWHNPSRRWLGVQLGAGHPSKTWDPALWARLANMILERHSDCNIILLGGPEDKEREKAFLAAIDAIDPRRRAEITSLVGETSFDLWASVVSRCQWVFAGDTAVIHLASVLGTRVLNLSIGPVRWAETGPYGNGHYVVSSARPDGALAPEAVYAAWSYASSEWAHRRQLRIETHFEQLGFREQLPSISVHRSRIRGTQDGGGVFYEPLISRSMTGQEWCSMVMGHIARSWYCGWVPPVGQELSRDSIGPVLIRRLREIEESAGVLAKILDEGRRTATQLSRRSTGLKSEKVMGIRDREDLQALGKKLMEIDGLLQRLGQVQPALLGFSRMGQVLMHNLRGAQISEMGKETAEAYRQLHDGVAILRDWLRFTLDLARPVAVKSKPLALVPDLGEPA